MCYAPTPMHAAPIVLDVAEERISGKLVMRPPTVGGIVGSDREIQWAARFGSVST
jgi:hypothetical protein